jgi:hypothetical protein
MDIGGSVGVGVCVGVGVSVGVSVGAVRVAEESAVEDVTCVADLTTTLGVIFGSPLSSTLAFEHPPRKIIKANNKNKARHINKRS